MFCKFLLDASSFIVGALHPLATPWLWACHHYHHHHHYHHQHHHNISTCVGCSLRVENHYFHLDGKMEIISAQFCSLEKSYIPRISTWFWTRSSILLLALTGNMIFPHSNCHFYSKLTGCVTYTSTHLSSLSLYTDVVHGRTSFDLVFVCDKYCLAFFCLVILIGLPLWNFSSQLLTLWPKILLCELHIVITFFYVLLVLCAQKLLCVC